MTYNHAYVKSLLCKIFPQWSDPSKLNNASDTSHCNTKVTRLIALSWLNMFKGVQVTIFNGFNDKSAMAVSNTSNQGEFVKCSNSIAFMCKKLFISHYFFIVDTAWDKIDKKKHQAIFSLTESDQGHSMWYDIDPDLWWCFAVVIITSKHLNFPSP